MNIYKLGPKEEQCAVFPDGASLQMQLRASPDYDWSIPVPVTDTESIYSSVNLPLSNNVQTQIWTQSAGSSEKERPSVIVMWPFCVFNNQTGLDLQLRKADSNLGKL
jgi:hypothetical protein